MELKFKMLRLQFHLKSANLYGNIGYPSGIQAITFLGNWPGLKQWHLEILTWASNCAIS